MAKSKETYSKKEKEKKRLKQKQDKKLKQEDRKANKRDGNSLEGMMDDIQIGAPKQEFSSEDSFRTGTVSFFNKAKGFGFINEDVSNERIFFHIKDMLEQVEESDKVKFQVERGPRGYSAILLSRNI